VVLKDVQLTTIRTIEWMRVRKLDNPKVEREENNESMLTLFQYQSQCAKLCLRG